MSFDEEAYSRETAAFFNLHLFCRLETWIKYLAVTCATHITVPRKCCFMIFKDGGEPKVPYPNMIADHSRRPAVCPP